MSGNAPKTTTRGVIDRSLASAVLIALLAIAAAFLAVFVSRGDLSSSAVASGLPFAFSPELYHGQGKTHHFFEGWYHKLVRTKVDCRGKSNNNTAFAPDDDIRDDDQSLSMAVVPGVFYDTGNNITGKNESHAFIFVTINGEKQHYYRFDLETEFKFRRHNTNDNDTNANDNDYYVEIGNNKFSKHGMSLDLVPRHRQYNGNDANDVGEDEDDDASIILKGSIEYEDISPWPIRSFWNLGAMGPVGYFLSPFLECYHDVLSFDHTLKGTLQIANHFGDRNKKEAGSDTNAVVSHPHHGVEEFFNSDCSNENNTYFSSRGYVEKDRGRSFPSLWIWMQTNSFRNQPKNLGTSLFFSVARIPILTTHLRKMLQNVLGELEFPGFTAAIWLNVAKAAKDDPNSIDEHNGATTAINTNETIKKLIPFATWTGAYFEDLVVEDEQIIVTLNSGGLGGAFWGSNSSTKVTTSSGSTSDAGNESDRVGSAIIRLGRFARAWIGSWFLEYDSRKVYYRLELIADRRVPHVLLYAPRTTTTSSNGTSSASSKMEPFVNEALNAKIHVRLYEYYRTDGGKDFEERLLLDDVGEHAGLEVHQNVQYLVDNLCGNPKANKLVCL